nr:sugar phosphate nucleotidyltransferase [Saprospiraceae bacterium]
NPTATDFGKELIPTALKSGLTVASYLYDGYWTDIGNIESFFEANIELASDLPKFNLFDNINKIYTRPRQLPPSKMISGNCVKSIISEGCIIHAKEISNSLIGIRSRIGENTVINNCYIMGNDFFETIDELKTVEIPIGIGKNCHIENAIIDKQARIGNNVIIKGDKSLPDVKTDRYVIRDGIIVVNKWAKIPDGEHIGKID